MLKINVTTAEAVVTETELITAGRKGLRCAFSFSEDWAGLAKTAIVQGAAARDIALLATNEIVVPAECVNKAQFPLKIGVYGALPDGTIAIPTIWASFGKVLPGAKPSLIPPDELTPDVVAQIQEAAGNALYLARNVQSMADSGALDGVSPEVTVTSITGGHNIKVTDRDHPAGQDFDVMDGTDGVSPGVTVTSITGGHTVTITDEDHPGGQTFNVLDGADGQDGQDGQDAVVDATLSHAGEAADAAETGKVKAMADRHDAELLAITPVSSSSNYTWYAGTAWSSSGTNTTNSLSARSAKKEVSPGTVIVNASNASANGKTLYIHVVEWNGSTFVKRSYIRPGGFVTIGAATDTYALNFAYDSGQSAPNMDAATVAENFGVRVVTKPSGGGGGGTSDYSDLTNKPQIEGVTLSGNKSLADLGIEPDVFYATYGTTTSAEIEAAYQAGKIVLVTIDVDGEDVVIQLVNRASSSSHVFTGVNGGDVHTTTCENSVWSTVTSTSIPNAYTSSPAALGTASAGSSGFWARGDHVHPKPSAADIGAVAANQGVSHAGKSLVVGSDGVVVPEDNRFVVTLTPTAADYSGVMDKTPNEITGAIGAGKRIIFDIPALGAFVEATQFISYIGDTCSCANITYSMQGIGDVLIQVITHPGPATQGVNGEYGTNIYPLATGQWTGGSY